LRTFRAGSSAASGKIPRVTARTPCSSWLRVVAAVLAAAIGGGIACRGKSAVVVPVVTTPKFPEFVQPVVSPAIANTPAAQTQARGWAFLQTGDLRTAEREFALALRLSPAFYQAQTSLGYVDLARKDPAAALVRFDRVLQTQANDAPALVGRGEALAALSRDDEAVRSFEAAIAADPSLTEVGRRVEVLRFRGAEQQVARARQAARSGQLDEAADLYAAAIRNSPDSPFLYRELAAVERQKGRTDEALEHLRKAVSLDPSDARSLAQIGDILDGRNEFAAAEEAYTRSLALEPNADVSARLEAVRGRAAIARLPAEYRAIDQAPQLTRADLAALIGIRLAPLLQGGRRTEALMTDVRASWAATWIVAVARAGVMEPFANHTFQPRALIHRIDLAQAIARLLPRIAARNPGQARPWEAARVRFSDLPPSHLAYPAASAAVASGVMTVGADNAFRPSRVVSGRDAVEAITRLQALAGVK